MRDEGRLQAFRNLRKRQTPHKWAAVGKPPQIRCNAARATLKNFHVPAGIESLEGVTPLEPDH
jgi:hypothetical protein